jgi:hypothetical protein
MSEVKEKKLSPFDFINDISFGKKDLMRGTDNDRVAEKSYNQFIVNRGLSYFPDTILYVNEMNIRKVPNRMHYTFLLNSIRSKKRFSKWAKSEDEENLELIQTHYNYSKRKAQDALKILTNKQIEEIKTLYNKGGKL